MTCGSGSVLAAELVPPHPAAVRTTARRAMPGAVRRRGRRTTWSTCQWTPTDSWAVSFCSAYSVTRSSARLGGLAVPRVDRDDRHLGGQCQGVRDLVERVLLDALELVDRHDERQPLVLEVVQRRERLVQAGGVDQDDRPDRAQAQVVPHEPEAALARGAEEVEDEVLGEGQASEVHGHGGGRLGGHRGEIVDTLRLVGDEGLGTQRLDLGDRADQRRLAHAETTGDHDLRRRRLALRR